MQGFESLMKLGYKEKSFYYKISMLELTCASDDSSIDRDFVLLGGRSTE